MDHPVFQSVLAKDPERVNEEKWNCTHFNSNRAVGISIKTTGSNPRLHEIAQICIYPLNTKLQLAKETMPFYMDIKPLKPGINLELMKGYLNLEKYHEIKQNGNMPQMVASLFENWMEDKIRPAYGKKLLPFTHNWAAMRPFIKKWLGPIRFKEYISIEYRDIMSLALFCNDYADFHCHQIPYPKVQLSFIANILKVEFNNMDDTILHVRAITEIYERMVRKILPTFLD